MTFAQDYAWAAARALSTAAAAVLVGRAVCGVLAAMPRRLGRVLWAAALIPYLTPVLLVGYAYSRYSLSLIRHPAWNEALYAGLVWLKLTPVAALILHFAPRAMSPEAAWCHRLLGRGRAERLGFWLRGSGRAFGVAFAAVFLLAFGEFEMASLMGIGSWTVSLFDAQVGGLALSESLRRVALPAVCELALLVFVLALLARRGASREPSQASRSGRAARAAVSLYLLAALGVITVVPMLVVLQGTSEVPRLLGESQAVIREFGASVLFGVAGAACAYGIAACGLRIAESRTPKCATAAALCAPGLLGALVLSLALLWVFQLRVLRGAYDTPAPLAVALTLLLLPFAVLLRLLLAAARPGEAVHAAAMLRASGERRVVRGGRRVVWRLQGQGKFWAFFLLFCWGYFDVTASAILAPSQMTPVWVRLYNFMHYGQTAALSAMVLVAFVVPVLLLGLFFASLRVLRG